MAKSPALLARYTVGETLRLVGIKDLLSGIRETQVEKLLYYKYEMKFVVGTALVDFLTG